MSTLITRQIWQLLEAAEFTPDDQIAVACVGGQTRRATVSALMSYFAAEGLGGDAAEAAMDARDEAQAAQLAAAGSAAAAIGLVALALAGAVEMGPTTSMSAVPVPVVYNLVRTTGYAAAGDGGAASFKRVASQPSHAGKFQDSTGQWWELAEKTVNPVMFGADPTYTADAAARLNQTSDYAAQKGASIELPADHAYKLFADNWYIKSGVRSIVGRGGIVRLAQSSGQRSIVLKGKTSGESLNVSSLTIQGVVLDANGRSTLGIYGQNSFGCRVQYNGIINNSGAFSCGIFFKSFANGGDECANNVITRNFIQGVTPGSGDGSVGIVLAGDQTTPYAGYADPAAEFKATHTNAAMTLSAVRNQVTENLIEGHYYGIGISGARSNTVTANTCRNNMRAISCQYRSGENQIAQNLLLENASSAIHIAFTCDGNQVVGNICKSTRCDSATEGLFQAYAGCTGNAFIGNQGTVTGASGPAFYAYTAIQSVDNSFIANTFSGPVQKAYMAVESGWDNTVTNPAHRLYGAGTSDNGFAGGNTNNIDFSQNVIRPTSAKPVFFLGQISDGGGSSPYLLQFVTTAFNTVKGTAYSKLYEILEETSGSSNSHTLRNNVHIAPASKFTLPRGLAHFQELADPLFNDNATEVAFADGDTTPSVMIGRNYRCVNGGATSITYFDDGRDGQVIDVRLDANTTLVHASGTLRLKGSVNVVGTSTSQIITLRRISGIWFEINRGF